MKVCNISCIRGENQWVRSLTTVRLIPWCNFFDFTVKTIVGFPLSTQTISPLFLRTVSGLNLAQIQYFRPINDPFASHAQLTGLAPDTSYRVYLAAATSKGNGENIFLDTKSLAAGRKLFHYFTL